VTAGCSKKTAKEIKVQKSCQRIVSTAPSITETLFKFGLGENVVGVTDNCSFPDAALKKEKVGKVLNINLEKVLSLKPDTVMVIDANPDLIKKLKALGLNIVSFNHTTIKGFISSLPVIGKACEKEPRFLEAVTDLKKSLKAPQKKKDLKVLFVIGRDYHSGLIKDVYVAGNDGFFSEIMDAAGVKNAYEGSLNYPKIQVEGIISLDPDVVVDIVPSKEFSETELSRLSSDWEKLKDVKAVKNKKIFMINKNYWSIPGPRFTRIINELKEILKDDDKTSGNN